MHLDIILLVLSTMFWAYDIISCHMSHISFFNQQFVTQSVRTDCDSYFVTTLNRTKEKKRKEKKKMSMINYNYYSSKITYLYKAFSKEESIWFKL